MGSWRLSFVAFLVFGLHSPTKAEGFLKKCADVFANTFLKRTDAYSAPTSTPEFYLSLQKVTAEEIDRRLRSALFSPGLGSNGHLAKVILNDFDELFVGAPAFYKGLLFDFGILDNWSEFSNFCKRNPKLFEVKRPHEIRELFSRELGTSTVYRGVAIPRDKFKNAREAINYLRRHGDWAPDLRATDEVGKKNVIDAVINNPSSGEWDGLVQGRYYGGKRHYRDVLVSVSEFPEIARNVGWYMANGGPNKNFIVLLTVEIPNIELIREYDGGFFDTIHFYNRTYRAEFSRFTDAKDHSRVEQFIPFHLNPRWIKSAAAIERYQYPIFERLAK